MLIYASSWDHYGPGSGPAYNNSASDKGWNLTGSGALFNGDGWTGNPVMGTASVSEANGNFNIAAPPWGARRGDYALVADQCFIDHPLLGGDTYTYNGSEGMNLAIPGASQDERIIHLAFSLSALPEADRAHGWICNFMDSGGNIRAWLGVSPSGRLQVCAGNLTIDNDNFIASRPTLLAASAAPVIQPETWYSINIKITTQGGATVAAPEADVEIYVGDIVLANRVINVSSVAFTDTGSQEIDIIGLLPPSAVAPLTNGGATNSEQTIRAIRDVVICDNTGSYNNDHLGQVFVSAQEMRAADADNWTAHPRQRFGTGVVDLSAVSSANNGIRIADNAALRIGSNDFTIEGQFRFDTLPGASDRVVLFSKWDETNNRREYKLEYNGSDDTLRWIISTDGTAETTVKSQPFVPDLEQWYHIAISRWTDTSGTFTSMFVDGVELGVPAADSNTYNGDVANVGIGARYDGTTIDAGEKFAGWIDELRFTVGSFRYSAPFSAPTDSFPRSVGEGDADFANVEILIGANGALIDESSNAWTLNAGANVAAITPNDNFALYGVLNQRPAWDDTFIEAENTFATGILTLPTNPSDGDTMTIGSQTYTFVNSFSTVPADEILIGADNDETIAHIIAAVNGGAGEGTDYGTGTSANTDAAADLLPSPQIVFTAATIGATGNSVATTETFTASDNVFGAGTLAGGADIPSPTDFTIERLPVDVTGVLAVQVTARGYKTEAGSADVRFDLKGPGGTVDTGTAKTTDLNPAWLRQVFEEDPDTSAGITPATVVGGRVRVTRTT